jgi:hypothetical protein
MDPIVRAHRPGIGIVQTADACFQGYSVDDAIRRNDAFFRCKESWTVGPRHNFSVFVKHFQRWIPTPARQSIVETHRDASLAVRETCPDHPDQQLVDGVCEICYPKCGKCKQNHATTETCEEFKQRADWVKRTFGGSQIPEVSNGPNSEPTSGISRGSTTTLSGSEVFTDKEKKEFREIRIQQERQR